MKKKLMTLMLSSALLAAPMMAHAHRAWLLPSATVLSADKPWVSVDAAVSNEIFHADHAPFRLDGLKVLSPDGTALSLQNTNTGKFRSTFDLELNQEGTYKVFTASGGLRARWIDDEGKRHFWPGRGQQADNNDFTKSVPKEAKELSVSYASRRIETFVTAGTPSTSVFKPTNQGLELVPVTHPNDLYAGETAKFALLIDGEPAENAEVTVLAGGMRYRDSQDEISAVTGNDGMFFVTWPSAGMYWMTVSYKDNHAKMPATERQGSYSATFEVLPQ